MTTITSAIRACLDGRAEPHQLPAPLHDLWRDGFHAGQQAANVRVVRAEHEADHWYYIANNPAESRARHEQMLRDHDIVVARREQADAWARLDGTVTEARA